MCSYIFSTHKYHSYDLHHKYHTNQHAHARSYLTEFSYFCYKTRTMGQWKILEYANETGIYLFIII